MGYSVNLARNPRAGRGLDDWSITNVGMAGYGITEGNAFLVNPNGRMVQGRDLSFLDFTPKDFKVDVTFLLQGFSPSAKENSFIQIEITYDDGSKNAERIYLKQGSIPYKYRHPIYNSWNQMSTTIEPPDGKVATYVEISVVNQGDGQILIDSFEYRHNNNPFDSNTPEDSETENSIITDAKGIHIYDGNVFEQAPRVLTLGEYGEENNIKLFGLDTSLEGVDQYVRIGRIGTKKNDDGEPGGAEFVPRYGLEIKGVNNTIMIDEYGIDPRFVKSFKNMIFNSSFERFDPASKEPEYWTGGVVVSDASFDNTHSLMLKPGVMTEQKPSSPMGHPRPDPAWWGGGPTRVSFMKKGGDVQVQVFSEYDFAPHMLTDEKGEKKLYYNTGYSDNWNDGKYTFSFVPDRPGRIWLRFTNISSSVAYLDAVQLEPDFNGKYPSFYSNGPFSLGSNEVPLSDTWLEYINIPYQPMVAIRFNQAYTLPPSVNVNILRNTNTPNQGGSLGGLNMTPNVDLIIESVDDILKYTGAVITWGGSPPSSIPDGYVSVQVIGRV